MATVEEPMHFRFSANPAADSRTASATVLGDRCHVHFLEQRWAAVVRFRSALDQLRSGFFHRYATLAASLIRRGQRPLGPPFATFSNSDDKAADVEAGFVVKGPLDPFADVDSKSLAEGHVVALTHTGPYEEIDASYFELLGWLDGQRLSRAGPFTEIYLNGPDTSDPCKTSTRIVVPVSAPALR